MSESSSEVEQDRVGRHPSAKPIAILATFLVHPTVPIEAYSQRIRKLISSAIEVAQNINFEVDDTVSTESLPSWFRELSDDASKGGAKRYVKSGLGAPWDPEEWIYCFDPDLRAWRWWDVTAGNDGVSVWIDSGGEPHFPHQELLWALFTSGATEVGGLKMQTSTEWRNEVQR